MAADDADIELLVIGFLTAQFPSPTRVLTDTPGDMATGTGFIQVAAVSGGDNRFTLVRGIVDIDCFQVGRSAARLLAYQVWQAMLFPALGYRRGPSSVSRVDTINAPASRPYDNTNVQRVGITVQVTVHAPTLAST